MPRPPNVRSAGGSPRARLAPFGRAALIALALTLPSACSPAGTPVSHGGPVRDHVSLVDQLRAGGYRVEPVGQVRQPFWLPAVALALALAGQAALYRAEGPTLPMSASWKFRPSTVREAREKAKAVVQAEVISVAPGADLVVPAAGEPSGEDRIPTQHVQVKVRKAHKGAAKPGDVLDVFQTGGKLLPAGLPDGKQNARVEAKQVVLEGDPLYQTGEEYVLFLEDGPRGMLRPVSPEGRFKVEKGGAVSAMVQNDATKDVHGKPLAVLERQLANP